jgi:dTDP-4-amino-4,6-dideoxygalactose transaminase
MGNKYEIKFSPPDITEAEINAVAEVMRSGWITTGPRTKQLEKDIREYVHADGCACFSSATAALECALRVLGIGPGDEVIVPAYTYTASASVVCHVGATLKLVDIAEDSFHIDYDGLEAMITDKTKAIIPVDIAGVMADYDRLLSLVQGRRGLYKPSNELQEALGRIAIVADSAHAFGASRNGRMSGECADFTAYSFHAVKNLTTGEGGALAWKHIEGVEDGDVYRKLMLYSLHGQSKDALAKTQLGAWEYDIVAPYYKYNMTDIMAAIGGVQLKRYPSILARRRQIIGMYTEGLADCPVTVLGHYGDQKQDIVLHGSNSANGDDVESSGHLYLVNLVGRDGAYRNKVIEELAVRGVATNVHYKPLPMHTAYKDLGFSIEDYPNSYGRFINEITLPLHTLLTDDQVEYVIECFRGVLYGA